ncbi:MAG: hypothetical protein K6T81_04355 [Alicyclobacillus macrosporangiidus]|uniref:hypothetical protein n=1 Tax=Alicyclobacillus macrosporangiidus TaxID=392015 RepID=UPI0026EE3C84|nr:hypothetical protein [Alicyclobacillus macrosporangiidus]MCL6597951.1 hypothetical protein [Alicyclobacillus macrosporangiidus]
MDGKPMKTENGVEFPAEAYAYVPDPEKPSTWKLRLWEDPDKKETARQVGMAVAALGEGFRGNKVEIPAEDLPKVKAKVRAAWKKTHPDASDDDMPDVLKKRRLRDVIKSWFAYEGLDLVDDDDDGAKPAHDLQTALQMDQYSDQLLGVLTAALADTVDSILDDPNVTDKQAQIEAALQDYSQRLQAVGIMKAGRKISASRMQTLKQIHDLLSQLIAEVDDSPSSDSDNNSKGDDQVSIDKSKLPEDVRKHIEGLEAQIEELKKSAAAGGGQQPQPQPEDIWKSMPEEVRKRFEEMEKRAREAEEIAKRERDERVLREYIAKAQAFRGLPVQPEEFGKVLKALAEKAPEEYQKVEDVLKAADEAIAKGKLFAELGKGGSGVTVGAYAQLQSIAKSKMEASGGKLTMEQAFAEAAKENPNLYEQYRKELS